MRKGAGACGPTFFRPCRIKIGFRFDAREEVKTKGKERKRGKKLLKAERERNIRFLQALSVK